MLKNGFVINPEKELLPDYRISPFTRKAMLENRELAGSDFLGGYLASRFPGRKALITKNGRNAIYHVLASLRLTAEDNVAILTTSGNSYISGCVTREIEKFCPWSRTIGANTKLILVNHEFGFPFGRQDELRATGLPILEDCAHSFFSGDERGLVGVNGDYSIFSLPKIFPIQVGGLLLAGRSWQGPWPPASAVLSEEEEIYIRSVTSHYLAGQDDIRRRRRANHFQLKELLKPLGITERFELKPDIVPGVFLFSCGLSPEALSRLKTYLYGHGIECSVFYGEQAFYIPVHQGLGEDDLVYFRDVIAAFFEHAIRKA